MDIEVEQEKIGQRRIIDEVVNCTAEHSQDSQLFIYCDPFPRERNQLDCEGRKDGDVGVQDLKGLFSGQQHSFLAGSSEDAGEYSGTNASQVESHRKVEVSEDLHESSCFFFHWSKPELANRLEFAFHTSRSKEELERIWPDQRSAMKKLLRHSHRHARQRKRTQKT